MIRPKVNPLNILFQSLYLWSIRLISDRLPNCYLSGHESALSGYECAPRHDDREDSDESEAHGHGRRAGRNADAGSRADRSNTRWREPAQNAPAPGLEPSPPHLFSASIARGCT